MTRNDFVQGRHIRSALALVRRIVCVLAVFGASVALAVPSGRFKPVATGFGGSGDAMGTATAILGDTALVGSPYAVPNGVVPSGAVQVFRDGASGWQREAILMPAAPVAYAGFGISVSLGADIAAIGSSGSSAPATTTLFVRDGTMWSQSAVLTYGGLPSLSGDTLAIASYDRVGIFTQQGGTWTLETELVPDADGTNVRDVRIDGDNLVFWTNTPNTEFGELVVYFYHRVDGAWMRDTALDLGSYPIESSAPAMALSGDSAVLVLADSAKVLLRGDGSWSEQQTLDSGIDWSLLDPSAAAIDGDTAVIGCPNDTVLGSREQGSAFVFARSGSTWTRVARPYDANGDAFAHFGASVAISGDHLIAGSPNARVESIATGKAIAFDATGNVWNAVASFDEGNAHTNEDFGGAVALSGSIALVGASNANYDTPGASGAAYVFEAIGSRWIQRARIVPPSPQHYGFGNAVAIDGDTAVVASINDNDGDPDEYGAVYVYARDGDDWPQQQRISSGAIRPLFGASVAIEDDLVAVGDIGANGDMRGLVRTFVRSGTTWTDQSTIQPVDGVDHDNFGAAVALSGTTLVAGAAGANVDIEQGAGAAYVFENAGGSWQQTARLTATAPLQGENFGYTVAIAGDTIVASYASPNGSTIAAIYVRDGDTWTWQADLDVDGAQALRADGVALSGDGSIALVGANAIDPGSLNSVYVFRRSGDAWSLTNVMHGDVAPTIDQFGAAVAMSGTDALVGAPRESNSGVVYAITFGDAIFEDGFE
jgi:hypothetical protein